MGRATLAFLLAALMAGPALANDPAIGIWKTEPDRKDLTSLIEVRQCGATLCAKILAAFDPSGRKVVTRNVGKELFWGMTPLGGGRYSGGTAWLPLLNVRVDASMALSGGRLRVEGCKGSTCGGQTWIRVR